MLNITNIIQDIPEWGMWKWRSSCEKMGLQLDEKATLYILHFADQNQVVVTQDYEDLEFMTRQLFKEYEKWV